VNSGPQNAASLTVAQLTAPIIAVSISITYRTVNASRRSKSYVLILKVNLLLPLVTTKPVQERTGDDDEYATDKFDNHDRFPIGVVVLVRKYILPTLTIIVAINPAMPACVSVNGKSPMYCSNAPADITTIDKTLNANVL
jgi:hypothetical protein